mgnify:CR=1 FL=1
MAAMLHDVGKVAVPPDLLRKEGPLEPAERLRMIRHMGVVEGLLAEVANYGTAMVKRIYGDWTTPSLNSWKKELLEHAPHALAAAPRDADLRLRLARHHLSREQPDDDDQ